MLCTNNADQTEAKRFKHFTIGNETEKYVFDYESVYDGYSIHELFVNHIKGMKFSTPNQDNDKSGGDCANQYPGGWWFGSCLADFFNGRYGSTKYASGIHWYVITNLNKSLKKTMMMVKENDD